MIRLFKHLHLTSRFFIVSGGVVLLFGLSFVLSPLYEAAWIAILLIIAFTLADAILLFSKRELFRAKRRTAQVISLGSENDIILELENRTVIRYFVEIVDELPFSLQKRDFSVKVWFGAYEKKQLTYHIKPNSRGAYNFGNILLYARSVLGFTERRVTIPAAKDIAVYPSIIEMKQFDLRNLPKISFYSGIKKMRRLGHSYEFEQIKTYVHGDDFRSINWKATGRSPQLMVNQYDDEKSQQIYSVIDKSRVMKMPFKGLSLLDYAINTGLVISNVALGKYDKVGLITFSDRIDSTVKAERGQAQLRRIMESLYREKEGKAEADYELLYTKVRNFVGVRSLLFLYTNFESTYSLDRVLPLLRRINKLHLLIVVVFENTELLDYAHGESHDLSEVYTKTIAAKFASEKQKIILQLKQYGIQTILTRPEDLSVNTVNKYLELKARGMI